MEPTSSSSPPRSLRAIVQSSLEPSHCCSWSRSRPIHTAIFPNPIQWHRPPCRPHPHARDAVPEPATTSSSLSPQRCAPRAVPEPVTLMTRSVPGPTTSSSSLSPRCPEPAMPSNLHRPWVCNVIFLPKTARLHCIFFFIILGLQMLILICYIATLRWYATLLLFCGIALMCYIVTLLWYTTLPLTCRIALICYIAFDMLHYFDMLHCHIVLICYIITFLWYATLILFCCIALMWYIVTLLLYATLPLTCRIALICCIAFDMLHYFDMLHCHIGQW
jgi:hypothetical protein